MECPRCGSTKVHKKGKRARKQRYQCFECKANFCEGVEYKSAYIYAEKLNKPCAFCGSRDTVRSGKLESGNKRYKCKTCGRRFSENSLLYPQKPKKVIKDVLCPSCNSSDIGTKGHREGRWKYYCRACGRTFIENARIKRHARYEIKKIISSVFMGKSIEKIASEFNTTKRNINGIMRNHYKEEKLTEEQKKLIIQYGYILKVPVESLAEYARCSQKACSIIIERCRTKEYLFEDVKTRIQKKLEKVIKNEL